MGKCELFSFMLQIILLWHKVGLCLHGHIYVHICMWLHVLHNNIALCDADQDDFDEFATVLTFAVGDVIKCIEVEIVSDAKFEGEETFLAELVLLTELDGRLRLQPSMTRIHILGEKTVQVYMYQGWCKPPT